MQALQNLSPSELVEFFQERPFEPVNQFVGLLFKDANEDISLEAFECKHDWDMEDLFSASEVVPEEELDSLVSTLQEGQDVEELIGWVMLYPNKLGLTLEDMCDFLSSLFDDEKIKDALLEAFALVPQGF